MPSFKLTGEHGVVITSETDANAGDFFAIQMLADTVFSVLTSTKVTFETAIGSVTFPKGAILYVGQTSTFTLASGSVAAYKNNPNPA